MDLPAANLSGPVPPSASVEEAVSGGLDLYLPPALIATGSVCNVLVLLVMRAPFFAHVSTSLYMCLTAVADNASLMVALPFHWLHVNYPDTIYRGQHSDILCSVLNFTGWCTSDMGIALTVAMTFERAFAVKFPLKAASICTLKRAKVISVIILLIVFAKDGHFLFKSKVVASNVTSHLCELKSDDAKFYQYGENIWPIFHNVFVFVSFVIIISSNVIIIKNVKDTKTFGGTFRKKRGSRRAMSRRSSTSRSRQLTIMLISDSVTIIVCTLPFALLDALSPHVHTQDTGLDHLIFSVCFYLLYVNRCANFFLYCISGERFRLGLKQLCARKSLAAASMYSTEHSGRRASDPGLAGPHNNNNSNNNNNRISTIS